MKSELKKIVNDINLGTAHEDFAGYLEDVEATAAAAASSAAAAGARQGVAVADAASAPTKEEFNALLASLRDAGLIASE